MIRLFTIEEIAKKKKLYEFVVCPQRCVSSITCKEFLERTLSLDIH